MQDCRAVVKTVSLSRFEGCFCGWLRLFLSVANAGKALINKGMLAVFRSPAHLITAQGGATCLSIVIIRRNSDKLAHILGGSCRSRKGLVLIPVEKCGCGYSRTCIGGDGQLREQQHTGQYTANQLFEGTTHDYVFINVNLKKLQSNQVRTSRRQ